MKMSRLFPGALVLAIVLMAFVAGIAQAETGAKWLVNGKDVGSLEPKLKINEVENKTGSLSFTTKGGTAVLILCTALEFVEGGRLIAEGRISAGRIKGTGCRTFLNEIAASNCEIRSAGQPNGTVISEKIEGAIDLDREKLEEGGKVIEIHHFHLVKFFPTSGILYLIIELGAKCSIGEQVGVTVTASKEAGVGFWLKDTGGNSGFLAEASTHLVVESLKALLALGQKAQTLGSTVLELDGVHKGLKWSGVPGPL